MAKEKKKKRKEEEEEKETEIDFGIGKLSFGGLFKGIGSLIDLANKVAKEGKEISGTKEFKIKGFPKEARGVYGFSVKTLAGGEPRVETFGNIKETPKGPVVKEVREPMVDVFDEKDYVLVVAELPGVSKENVDFEIKGDILTISAKTKERKYAKEVLLPCAVDAKGVTSSYKNGILEIKLQKGKKK
ncbi:Hsp20/alpha crystallin family protein [bacterium]|nr:Hsp20/alpha crystallin family protein [bacterium]